MNPPCYKNFFIFFLFISSYTLAQNPLSYSAIENITTKQGLSNNSAGAIMQDSKGFIWITTHYGLNRYDGYDFKIYNYNIADTNSISPGWYYSILEDKSGIIWMSSSTQGFFSFDPRKEKFFHYYHQPNNVNSLAGDIGYGNMKMDASGIIWICTTAGLNAFDPVKKKFELFTHRENDSLSLRSNTISWLCPDDENNLWIITSSNEVNVFNIDTRKVTAHFAIGSPQMPGNKNLPVLNSISKGENGNIWISSESNGLYSYNTGTKTWRHFFNNPGDTLSIRNGNLDACLEDKDGNLIIPVSGGLDFYDAASGRFYYSDLTKIALNIPSISSVIRDRSGKIWMACGNNGILTIDPPLKKIESIQKQSLEKNSIKSNLITGFCHTKQNELLISGENGVYKFDLNTKTIFPFRLTENGQDIFDRNITWLINEDINGLLWFCTLNGLISYNPLTGKHKWYKHDEKDPTSLSAYSATGIRYSDDGKYWVTTFGGGLDILDPATGKFKAIKVHNGSNSISTNYIYGSFKDSREIIYMGSWYGGLIQFDPLKETFRIYRHDISDSNSISSDVTWPLYEDLNGYIWIGTVGGGLNVFDPPTEKFKAFTMKDGLPSDAMVSMINDNDGKTWIGTYQGLVSCSLPQKPFDKNVKINFRYYDLSDGLPSNDLNFLGAYKERNGTLFFATSTGGFFFFKPQELKENEYNPPVYITGFSLQNKPVVAGDSDSILKYPIEYTNEIKLSYKQNIISFSFAALNYIHPEKNEYAYKLEGYDKDWIYTNASKRFATYTNLEPKKYIFKVKAANNDGKWNEIATELTIDIKPPFWKTLWFKFLIVLLTIGLLYTFYRYRIGQILLLQRIRNKIAADLHDDIGSTLNSISIFSEVAKKDETKRDQSLQMIGESSRKIVDSLSDIVWSINPENDNFDKIIFRMRSLSYNLLKAKKIECSFHADESLSGIKLPMEIRRNFYLIFKEALNNLVKYSQAANASVLISREHGSITCVVRDDGVGFEATQDFSGNGLNNMKKRAYEIGAILLINSSVGKGTSIELILKT